MKDEDIEKVAERVLDAFDNAVVECHEVSAQEVVEVFGRVLGVIAASFDKAFGGALPAHVFILKFAECTREYGLYLQEKLLEQEEKEYKLPDTKKYKNN